MEILAGDIDGAAVAQVAAVGQIHAQNGVPRLRQREEGRQIGVGTGVGLNIGILAAEQLAGPLAGQLLRNVHRKAAAVIAVAGIALCIFVRQTGAHGQHDSGADNIF